MRTARQNRHYVTMNLRPRGEIIGDVYWTERDSVKHFLRLRQGYAISVYILDMLKAKKVKRIRIEEHGREDGKIYVYECYVSDYDFIEPFQIEGFDPQKCLALRRMRIVSVSEV